MKFLYVGRVNLPQDAASLRVYNIGTALMMKGHRVDYVCQEGTLDNGVCSYDGRTYYAVHAQTPRRISLALDWLFGRRTARLVESRLAAGQYDGVILYNVAAPLCRRIMKLCRRYKAALFHDVTEWYEIGNGAFASTFAYLVDRRIRRLDKKSDGVIAISPYLAEYYKGKVPVVQIPPLFTEKPLPNTANNGTVPHFLYAGSPSKKDTLTQFLQTVQRINQEKIRVRMTLIGAPIPDDASELEQHGITYLPRMKQQDIAGYIAKHDFTVLLRPAKRYAQAGYSTKVAESLFNGTPVFCNEIGGADTDVRSGKTGIKIQAMDVDAIQKGIEKVLSLSSDQIAAMKQQCFTYGQNRYTTGTYVHQLDEFCRHGVQTKR